MFEGIKNMIRKVGAKMGTVQSLTKITDHPKISVDASEYDRINESLKFFEGNFPDVKYRNTYGKELSRPYRSINMMKVVSKRMASLLYNEKSRIQVGDENNYKNANDFIQQVFSDNEFNKNLERFLESYLALGGLVMRPYYDKAQDKVKLTWAQAPSIFPLKNNTNDVSDIAIATTSRSVEGGKTIYYTLLEFHEWENGSYQITNELYRSEESNVVGLNVPLNMLYDDLAPVVTINKLVRPLFVYMKPQGFNNRNIVSSLGIGICDNALSTLVQINDIFDQFNHEINMGQRKVVVPESMTEVVAREGRDGRVDAKQVFDPNQDVFIKIPGDSDSEIKPTDITANIRTEQYVPAINNGLRMLEMQIGLSSGTFSFDAKNGIQTATEVVSENSMTYQTRSSQLTSIERAIKELIISILEVGRISGVYSGDYPSMDDISVDFDDGVFSDKQQQLDFFIKATGAKLAPRLLAIQRVFGLTEDQAQELLNQIDDETTNTPEVTGTGTPGFMEGDG